MGHLYEKAGLPVSSFIGAGLIGYRMYPGGLLLYIAFAVQLLILTPRVGGFGWICLAFPIPILYSQCRTGYVDARIGSAWSRFKSTTLASDLHPPTRRLGHG